MDVGTDSTPPRAPPVVMHLYRQLKLVCPTFIPTVTFVKLSFQLDFLFSSFSCNICPLWSVFPLQLVLSSQSAFDLSFLTLFMFKPNIDLLLTGLLKCLVTVSLSFFDFFTSTYLMGSLTGLKFLGSVQIHILLRSFLYFRK